MWRDAPARARLSGAIGFPTAVRGSNKTEKIGGEKKKKLLNSIDTNTCCIADARKETLFFRTCSEYLTRDSFQVLLKYFNRFFKVRIISYFTWVYFRKRRTDANRSDYWPRNRVETKMKMSCEYLSMWIRRLFGYKSQHGEKTNLRHCNINITNAGHWRVVGKSCTKN